MEIESLLQRLSDSNDEMSQLLGGAGDARSHLLARHRDILQVGLHTQEGGCTKGEAHERRGVGYAANSRDREL